MWRIAKSFEFSASHQLTHLPPEHPCARLHGHNYTVVLILQAAQTDPESNMVLDFRELDRVKRYLDQTFDHRHLNDVLGKPELTTSEGLACVIFQTFAPFLGDLLLAVRVRETEKTMAEYWRPGACRCGGDSGG
jgi:6-pyruvoyltetrahydropterin/6-carboxytetrahydropterin synthase